MGWKPSAILAKKPYRRFQPTQPYPRIAKVLNDVRGNEVAIGKIAHFALAQSSFDVVRAQISIPTEVVDHNLANMGYLVNLLRGEGIQDFLFPWHEVLKFENRSIFDYSNTMTPLEPTTTKRRGARRMSAVPESIRSALAAGTIETANLMEWLAADMCALALSVAGETSSTLLRKSLKDAALQIRNAPILARLRIAGDAISGSVKDLESRAFLDLAGHRSDLVRQWACYAANSTDFSLSSEARLEWTLRFAADKNMSVREAAWMAYRPHLQRELPASLRRLERVCASGDANLRRFSVEVCRPRSVWGAHIRELKQEPSFALPIIEGVRADESRYVQLAAGNWLNDASKTRPDWVTQLCSRWREDGEPFSSVIVKRGLRSLRRTEGLFPPHPELPLNAPENSSVVLQGVEP